MNILAGAHHFRRQLRRYIGRWSGGRSLAVHLSTWLVALTLAVFNPVVCLIHCGMVLRVSKHTHQHSHEHLHGSSDVACHMMMASHMLPHLAPTTTEPSLLPKLIDSAPFSPIRGDAPRAVYEMRLLDVMLLLLTLLAIGWSVVVRPPFRLQPGLPPPLPPPRAASYS